MPESAAERLVAWLWEDERLTAGLDDIQAGSLLQWASRRVLTAAAQAESDQQQLRQALRSVFSAARRVLPVTDDLVGWADRQLDQVLAASDCRPAADVSPAAVAAETPPTTVEPPALPPPPAEPESASALPEQDEQAGDIHG